MLSAVLYRVGTVARQVGRALDNAGLGLQGPFGVKETLSRHQTLMGVGGKRPVLGENAFVAPNASVIGDVRIGDHSSVWYNSTIRGDVNSVVIGSKTNIQDGVVVHVARHGINQAQLPTVIGDRCTIGHGAILHACTVEDGCLIGMGSTLLDGVKVCPGAMVAAGATVPPSTVISSGEIWAGSPAKLLRQMEPEEADFIETSADSYAELALYHLAENSKTFAEIEVDRFRRWDRLKRDPDYDSHLGIVVDPVTREIIAVPHKPDD